MRALATSLLALSLAIAAPGRAEDTGITLALRTGIAVPMGDASSGDSLSNYAKAAIPIWLDAGYRIDQYFTIGVYFEYGFGFPGNLCPANASCSVHGIRFGAEGFYNILPDRPFSPWVGLGFGYESASASATLGGVSGDRSASGFEILNLQLGGDYKASPKFNIGPFMSFSLAQYSSFSQNGASLNGVSTAMHEWFRLGVKGTFNL